MSERDTSQGPQGQQTEMVRVKARTADEHQPSANEVETLKRTMYERMSRRGKKWVDKIGYENWDPLAEPKHPIDIRTDATKMTSQDLMIGFFNDVAPELRGQAFDHAAREMALGIVNREERTLGALAFARWYLALLEKRDIDVNTILKG